MNCELIGLLGGFGVLMGVASVLGFTNGMEGLLWLVIGIICVVFIVWRAPLRPFLHGFFVSLIGGAVAPVIQSFFFSAYMANNPELSNRFAEIPGGLDARYFVVMLAPIIGLISGLVLGLASWVAAKLVGRNRTAARS